MYMLLPEERSPAIAKVRVPDFCHPSGRVASKVVPSTKGEDVISGSGSSLKVKGQRVGNKPEAGCCSSGVVMSVVLSRCRSGQRVKHLTYRSSQQTLVMVLDCADEHGIEISRAGPMLHQWFPGIENMHPVRQLQHLCRDIIRNHHHRFIR